MVQFLRPCFPHICLSVRSATFTAQKTEKKPPAWLAIGALAAAGLFPALSAGRRWLPDQTELLQRTKLYRTCMTKPRNLLKLEVTKPKKKKKKNVA